MNTKFPHTDNDTAHLELQALYKISQFIGSALDLDEALPRILGVLHDVLRMERATWCWLPTKAAGSSRSGPPMV